MELPITNPSSKLKASLMLTTLTMLLTGVTGTVSHFLAFYRMRYHTLNFQAASVGFVYFGMWT